MEQVADSIEQQVHRFLLATFPLARRANTDRDSRLIERGIIDSLGILDIVGFIETTFDIHIDDEDLVAERFQTIAAISHFVLDKQRQGR